MQNSHRKRSVLSAALTIGLTPAASVLAAPVLEEVIVTAQKREELLQDVPISIAAFTQSDVEKFGINDIKGLASKVPNVLINEFTGSSTTIRLFIRGVGQNDVQITQDPSVGLYLDGVYIGSSVGTAFESADIERIEVLRGPQGTLYGRNSTGGAINLITRKADPDAFSFRQTFTMGNYDQLRSRSMINTPLGERAAVKVSYLHSQRDGIVENLGNGEDWGSEERDNLTADLHFDINDQQVIDYKFERTTTKDTSRLSQLLSFDASAANAAIIAFANPALTDEGDPLEATRERLGAATAFDEQETGDIEITGHTLNFTWDISEAMTFKSITGYREFEAFSQNAQTPTTSLFGQFSITNGRTFTEFEQFTQEFQLLGDTDNLTWVGGVFYYEDEAHENANSSNSNGSENIAEGLLTDITTTENTAIAVFGQATWTPAALDERWHFTLGARYSDDTRKAFRDNNRVSFGFAGAPTPVPAFRANYDKDFSKFNPSFIVEYDLSDDANVYAKVISAYKSGGTSQRSTSSEGFESGFSEEDLVSYELGYKGSLAGGRARINAALFHMDYDDYQQSVSTGRNAGERDFINIEDATITGFEMDVTVAMTESLTATFSYGYLDTAFGPDSVSYQRIDDAAPTGFTTITDVLTEDLALAPEHTATLTLDYGRELSFGYFNANTNVQYQDTASGGVVEPASFLDARTLLGANISVSDIQLGSDGGRLKVALWGKNLLDQNYFVGNIRQAAFDTLGLIGLATFGDPRMYGITLEYAYQ